MRVPEPELGRDAIIEPSEDGLSVRPLRRCREPQQDLHPKAIEQGAIRWRLGVMELVDDDDVIRLGRELSQSRRVQGLNGCEHVCAVTRPATTNQKLTEVTVPHGRPEGRLALL